MNSKYWREYLYILILGSIFSLVLAFLTFQPSDPTTFNLNSLAFSAGEQWAFHNALGVVGANIADWGWQILGLSAPLFTSIFLIEAFGLFRQPKPLSHVWLKIFGYPQLIVSYSILLALFMPRLGFRGAEFATGGWIGLSLVEPLQHSLGVWGTASLVGTWLIASMALALGLRPLSFGAWCLELIPLKRARAAGQVLRSLDEDSKN